MEGEADVLEDGGVVVGFGDVCELEEGRHGEEEGRRGKRRVRRMRRPYGEREKERREESGDL